MNRYDQFAAVQTRWSAPPELQCSAPRPVRLSAVGAVVAVTGVILLLAAIAAGVLLSIESNRQTRNYQLLAEQGRETDATISRLWRTGEKGKNTRVEYWFDFAGRTYRKAAKVPLRVWRELELNGTLPVRFLPTDPEVNHPSGVSERPLLIFVPILSSISLAALSVICWIVLRRQIDLLAEGRPAPGVVTKISKANHGHESTTVVHFDFRKLSGGIQTGKTSSAGSKKKIGDPLCVLYDPNNPRRNAIYPLSLVRVVLR
jgi:uncharacterized protein DUF3592